jgi:16S rRNA (uracil1498-N3)-methyltransferase
MLRRLFSIEPLARTGDVVRLDPHESHHGRNVLRLAEGDGLIVFDGAGRQFAATVERFENKRLVVVLGEPTPAAPEPPVPVALYLALVKGDAFENVLQRAVELGVGEIVPFVAERSVPMVGKGAALERKIERWRQILLGATKQCGRACLTAITPPLPFADALCRPNEPALRFCCVPDRDAPEMSKMLQVAKPASAPSLALMIGPEGGLSPDEIATARRSDWHLVSLGPRTLRVETAATAALTLILGSLDEM